MTKYNGHKNWNHWNVSLWVNNDEGLYNLAKKCIFETRYLKSFTLNGITPRERAAIMMCERLSFDDITHTPDGAPYTKTTIRAAMRGM